jgi:hypothetical protein
MNDSCQSCVVLDIAIPIMSLFARQETQEFRVVETLAITFHGHLENSEGEVFVKMRKCKIVVGFPARQPGNIASIGREDVLLSLFDCMKLPTIVAWDMVGQISC